MILTLTIRDNKRYEFDIQVPSAQKIGDTIQVLMENGLLDCVEKSICQIFSFRNEDWLDITKTYEENEVYTADIICITYEEEKRDEREE